VSDELYIRKGRSLFEITTMSIGRISVRSSEEASNYVKKLKRSEDIKTSKGSWKNSVLLIADDDRQNGAPDTLVMYSSAHETFLEDSLTSCIPKYVNQYRIYMNLYPTGENYTKPTATTDMIKSINSGNFLTIFSGHGSERQITDERLFTVENIGSLKNRYYPIFLFLSCTVGGFHTIDNSLSDVLLQQKDFGAVNVVSATNETTASDNALFGAEFVKNLYNKSYYSIGEIVNITKFNVKRTSMTKLMHLFGDPASVIILPQSFEIDDNSSISPFETVAINQKVAGGVWNYNITFRDALKYQSYKTPY